VFTKENISQEQLNKVCKSANIYHFIKTIPKGFDAIMDDTMSISAGEKQLFTIARAMIKNPPMIILDEATSNVDTMTEVRIQESMDALMKGRTSFVIAHRLSTIKNADLILVINDGDIVEKGNHKQLLKAGKFYASLYNSQFSDG
jgi:ATP-binding cassette subfamily B protein